MSVDVVTRLSKGAPLSWAELDQNFINLANSAVPSSSVFYYKAVTNSQGASDPGTGKMKWNNSNQQASTELYFDWITDGGFDIHVFLQDSKIGDTFIIQDADFALNWQKWKLIAATNMPDWFQVDVELIEVEGSGQMQNNARVALIIEHGGTPVSAAPNQIVFANAIGKITGSNKLRFIEDTYPVDSPGLATLMLDGDIDSSGTIYSNSVVEADGFGGGAVQFGVVNLRAPTDYYGLMGLYAYAVYADDGTLTDSEIGMMNNVAGRNVFTVDPVTNVATFPDKVIADGPLFAQGNNGDGTSLVFKNRITEFSGRSSWVEGGGQTVMKAHVAATARVKFSYGGADRSRGRRR